MEQMTREQAIAFAESRARGELEEVARRDLLQTMSDISEDYYCAGWLIGLEFTLWGMVRGDDRRWGLGTVKEEEVAALRRLSEGAGGWWVWSTDADPFVSGPVFLSMPLWERAFKAGPDDGHVRAEFIAEVRALAQETHAGTGAVGPMTWGLSTDEESFHGHYASKEEALANVAAEIGPLEPGQRFWVGGGRLWRPTQSVGADRLFDALAEHACDECGEIAEDWLSAVSREDADALEADLHAVVLAWLARTGLMPGFYCCEVTEELRAPAGTTNESKEDDGE